MIPFAPTDILPISKPKDETGMETEKYETPPNGKLLLIIITYTLEKRLLNETEKETSYQKKRNEIFLGTPAACDDIKEAIQKSENASFRLTTLPCTTPRFFMVKDKEAKQASGLDRERPREISIINGDSTALARNPNTMFIPEAHHGNTYFISVFIHMLIGDLVVHSQSHKKMTLEDVPLTPGHTTPLQKGKLERAEELKVGPFHPGIDLKDESSSQKLNTGPLTSNPLQTSFRLVQQHAFTDQHKFRKLLCMLLELPPKSCWVCFNEHGSDNHCVFEKNVCFQCFERGHCRSKCTFKRPQGACFVCGIPNNLHQKWPLGSRCNSPGRDNFMLLTYYIFSNKEQCNEVKKGFFKARNLLGIHLLETGYAKKKLGPETFFHWLYEMNEGVHNITQIIGGYIERWQQDIPF